MDAHVNGRKRKRSALVADFDSEDDTDFRPCKRRKKRQFSWTKLLVSVLAATILPTAVPAPGLVIIKEEASDHAVGQGAACDGEDDGPLADAEDGEGAGDGAGAESEGESPLHRESPDADDDDEW
eukprot:CAMPEP_0174301248 /NCGR_PEP_ID=MMETSP0809-20121228/58934_1 /TAXON_ID=73025 ORGANISM="Eutreptiella gymnastica-like, Strain CCMP1594" /NCGR_SAMPLE_ID=MMETSP0809 /ASSEMBLY_ACC=CAM_ASM_000658 /LENGTH=124 /DNA_ID=CAMNT_0015406963 /DNA_START=26 /DNA_END=397 /DNA_ORIENTATION=-